MESDKEYTSRLQAFNRAKEFFIETCSIKEQIAILHDMLLSLNLDKQYLLLDYIDFGDATAVGHYIIDWYRANLNSMAEDYASDHWEAHQYIKDEY